jgi:hypothetical protein
VAERAEIDLGTPGASARREHERRHQASWKTGAEGEERLGAHLAKTCPGAIVLHDRRIPAAAPTSTTSPSLRRVST